MSATATTSTDYQFASPSTGEGGTRVPPGEYVMRLTDFTSEPGKFERKTTDGKTLPPLDRLKFVLTVITVERVTAYPEDIDEEDDDAVEVFEASLEGKDHWVFTNNTMSPKGTLRGLLQGMRGKPFEKNDEAPKVSDFLGRDFKVTLGWQSYEMPGSSEVKERLWPIAISPIGRKRRGGAAAADGLPTPNQPEPEAPLF